MTPLLVSESSPARRMEFAHPWRPYQRRVLGAADTHLADGRIHIVAAPGAGKTSLGLELFRRLDRPALVLAPTRAIRDQWLARLEDFLRDAEHARSWTSDSLDRPAFLTAITYQALHGKSRRRKERTDQAEEVEELERDQRSAAPTGNEIRSVLATLERAGIGTVILDEAHHLQKEWWKVLDELLAGLGNPTRISLTATPPYEASGRAWDRYRELCGRIDEEISVPELVRAGTLCPHQDFVYAVEPEAEEAEALAHHELAAWKLELELLEDREFRAALARHPFLRGEEPDAEAVLEQPEQAVALCVFLRTCGEEVPRGLTRLLGVHPRELPPMDRELLELLLESYFYDRSWKLDERQRASRADLKGRLVRDGLLSRRELRIARSRPLERVLSLSRAKIRACVEVFERERDLRGARLRQVVLTDYVRDESFQGRGVAVPRLGAWPVFRALARAAGKDSERVALLTGRLAVVHESLIAELSLAAGGRLEVEPLTDMPGFRRVAGGSESASVNAFTQLLGRGAIRVLVGTRALLGEGWDAPAVNSLVLASFVGSFVTTNQMRGRAIRVDPSDPDKVASLWHLVAVDSSSRVGGSDLLGLRRRFDTFVGLSAEGDAIESGLGRLALPPLGGSSSVEDFNTAMRERLERLAEIPEQWSTALEGAVEQRILPTLRTTPPRAYRRYHLLRTLAYAALQALSLLGFLFAQGLRAAETARGWVGFSTVLAGAAALAFLLTLPAFLRCAWALARHLPVDGSVRQIALALRDALCVSDLIQTPRRRVKVKSRGLGDGSVSVVLRGASFREQSLFADALAELFDPIGNPRYLITRSGRRGSRRDDHAVPSVLGQNKDRAQNLLPPWRRRVGPSELVYTRNAEGRQRLLVARIAAFSHAMAKPSERVDRWH